MNKHRGRSLFRRAIASVLCLLLSAMLASCAEIGSIPPQVSSSVSGAQPVPTITVMHYDFDYVELSIEGGDWKIPWDEMRKVSVLYTMNGEVTDITAECSFSSDRPDILTAAHGLLYGKSAGTAHFTVTRDGETLTHEAEVLDANPTGIWFYDKEIVLPLAIYNAVGLQYSMILGSEYDNGKAYDATRKAVWQVDNPAIATVKDGVITALSPGRTKISAVYGKFRTETTLQVFDDTPDNLIVSPGSGEITAGGDPLAIHVQLRFNGKGDYLIDELAGVHNRTPKTVHVSYEAGELLIYGLEEGTAQITVSAFGLSETVVITVKD